MSMNQPYNFRSTRVQDVYSAPAAMFQTAMNNFRNIDDRRLKREQVALEQQRRDEDVAFREKKFNEPERLRKLMAQEDATVMSEVKKNPELDMARSLIGQEAEQIAELEKTDPEAAAKIWAEWGGSEIKDGKYTNKETGANKELAQIGNIDASNQVINPKDYARRIFDKAIANGMGADRATKLSAQALATSTPIQTDNKKREKLYDTNVKAETNLFNAKNREYIAQLKELEKNSRATNGTGTSGYYKNKPGAFTKIYEKANKEYSNGITQGGLFSGIGASELNQKIQEWEKLGVDPRYIESGIAMASSGSAIPGVGNGVDEQSLDAYVKYQMENDTKKSGKKGYTSQRNNILAKMLENNSRYKNNISKYNAGYMSGSNSGNKPVYQIAQDLTESLRGRDRKSISPGSEGKSGKVNSDPSKEKKNASDAQYVTNDSPDAIVKLQDPFSIDGFVDAPEIIDEHTSGREKMAKVINRITPDIPDLPSLSEMKESGQYLGMFRKPSDRKMAIIEAEKERKLATELAAAKYSRDNDYNPETNVMPTQEQMQIQRNRSNSLNSMMSPQNAKMIQEQRLRWLNEDATEGEKKTIDDLMKINPLMSIDQAIEKMTQMKAKASLPSIR